MQKKKRYERIKFSARILRLALERLRSDKAREYLTVLTVQIGDEQWTFDNIEEFLSQYAKTEIDLAQLYVRWSDSNGGPDISLEFARYKDYTVIGVTASARSSIDSVFAIFDEATDADKIKDAPPENDEQEEVKIFIGHGRKKEWEKLKAHLQDKHGLDVIAYETGARAGHTIRDILDSMADESSMALLVLTGEDKSEDGLRARQNVIHETGLFQGRLGFDRAIMLVENGVKLASNFDGIQQLRFKKGHISEVFGDVLATIKREFGSI